MPPTVEAQGPLPSAAADSVQIRLVDTDLRAAIQALGRYLSKPVLVASIPGTRVTLETPQAVARSAVPELLRGLAETNGLELTEDSAYYRITPRAAAAQRGTGAGSGGSGSGPILLHVMRLKHARARDVAATVNLLFGGSGAFAGSGGLSEGTLGDELRRGRQGVKPESPEPPQVTPTASAPALARASQLSGEVTIVPDELTNSLLIRASDADFETLQAAVEQLDVRPLQVLIEVLIVEARKDRSFSLNADLFLPAHPAGEPEVAEGRVRAGSSGVGEMVIRLMGLGKPDIDAVLNLSETRGDVKIVSRPVILASNNTEARILVGSQRPFVQVRRSLPTDVAQRDQVVQYRDVGTKLSVRPTINQDGYVSLLIQQEINSATGEVAFDAPVISTREATTQILVRDSQTIVLGGLRDQQRDRSGSGVPILSGIPIIGGLFGSSSRRTTETELYLFLTPRIIRSDEDADRLTEPKLHPDSLK